MGQTAERGIVYDGSLPNASVYEAFSDSDWCVGHSTSGGVHCIGGRAVGASSKRQHSIALSSTEAEIIAASATALEVVYVRRLLHETRLPHTRSESRAPSCSTHAWQLGSRVPTRRCARSARPSPRGHRSGTSSLCLRARRPSARLRPPRRGAERCTRQRRRSAGPRGGSSRLAAPTASSLGTTRDERVERRRRRE